MLRLAGPLYFAGKVLLPRDTFLGHFFGSGISSQHFLDFRQFS
jgi:hypothetical protein